MITRKTGETLQRLMRQFPAVALLGARQVGKTTLAKATAERIKSRAVYYDLEKQNDRLRLMDPETTLHEHRSHCVIIDEAQAMPELFTALRPLIDEHRKPGRFLLLGSVSPHLVKGISETLAGRVAQIELPPVTCPEAADAGISLRRAWFRGGYPEPLLYKKDEQWVRWMDQYFRSFIQRDVNFLAGEGLSPRRVARLWQMLAGVHGNMLNLEMLARSLGMSRPTVSKYLDFLEGSFLISLLPSFHSNIRKRIVKAPKIYFRDAGILHFMQGITSYEKLLRHPAVGNSWEGYVIEQIRQMKPYGTELYYYRTHQGAEADAVIASGGKPLACIEIKLSNNPAITRGWNEVRNDLKTEKNFILTPSSDDFPYDRTARVCGVETFLKKYLKTIR